jgi:thioredoxin reductase (NADPH)
MGMVERREYDIIIVGGGVAGLTAALFAARHGHSTLVLEAQVPGGHLVNIHRIEEFPGFPEGVAGYELCPQLEEQTTRAGAAFALETVERVWPDSERWQLATSGGTYMGRAVIVASGSRARPLGVPGEARLFGRGVSQCASCDGPLFRDQVVAVVGGGDSALQEALSLTEYAARVVVIHRGTALRAQHAYLERVQTHPAIEVRFATTVTEILGDTTVQGIRVRDSRGTISDLALAGVFIYVGLTPNTAFLQDLDVLDAAGRVRTDIWMRTRQHGLLAAGDVRAESASQAITAAGDGATAALAAHRYLTDGAWDLGEAWAS